MRKTKKSALLGALLALVAGGALSLAVTPASATTPCTDGSVVVNGNTASVSNDADSGDHGNWATDPFYAGKVLGVYARMLAYAQAHST